MTSLPKGIGPHEGQELELLLKGTKKAAYFSDFLGDDGTIPEEIIPEKAFAPFIKSKKIKYNNSFYR